jgi:hypothetical protein
LIAELARSDDRAECSLNPQSTISINNPQS